MHVLTFWTIVDLTTRPVLQDLESSPATVAFSLNGEEIGEPQEIEVPLGPPPPPKPKEKPKALFKSRTAPPIQKIVFYGNGIPRRNIYNKQSVTIDVKSFSGVSFRATTNYHVSQVVFYAGGSKYYTDTKAPYFIEGTNAKWKNPIFNREFKLQVWAEGTMTTVFITLKK